VNNYLIFGLGWVFGAINTWLVMGVMLMNNDREKEGREDG